MTAIQTIIAGMESSKTWLETFIGDFTDAELLVRPVPGANHAAWQIGNVICGDPFLVQTELPDAVFPELPAGFSELHSKAGASKDSDAGFLTKAAYLKLLTEVRTAAIAATRKLSDSDLDRPSSDGIKWAGNTLGDVLMFVPTHTLMHAGQFSVIRRKLGKPVLF
jgi:DinB superfamily